MIENGLAKAGLYSLSYLHNRCFHRGFFTEDIRRASKICPQRVVGSRFRRQFDASSYSQALEHEGTACEGLEFLTLYT